MSLIVALREDNHTLYIAVYSHTLSHCYYVPIPALLTNLLLKEKKISSSTHRVCRPIRVTIWGELPLHLVWFYLRIKEFHSVNPSKQGLTPLHYLIFRSAEHEKTPVKMKHTSL